MSSFFFLSIVSYYQDRLLFFISRSHLDYQAGETGKFSCWQIHASLIRKCIVDNPSFLSSICHSRLMINLDCSEHKGLFSIVFVTVFR